MFLFQAMKMDGGRFYCQRCLRKYLDAFLSEYDRPESEGDMRERIWATFLK